MHLMVSCGDEFFGVSANQHPNSDDRPKMVTPQVSRHDEMVKQQFVSEVAETLEFVRTVSMAGSQIDDVSTSEILDNCMSNLVELGTVLCLDSFLEAVNALWDVLRFDPFEGELVDKNLDRVLEARFDWPSTDCAE